MILRVTTTAICGSDLHIYDGYIPTMKEDDILGHEFMGIVEEAGANHPLKKGDRVLIPFQISCGTCHFCKRMETALCDSTNPEGKEKMEKAYGQAAAGLFGCTPISMADIPADRLSMFACHARTSGPLRCLRVCLTSRYCFSRTFSRLVLWRLRIAASSPARPSPSGVAVQSDNSLFAAHSCWEQDV